MAEIPHFAWPFRYMGGEAVVNQQGSADDVLACVSAVLGTEPGQIFDEPDFGVPDPTFEQEPISTAAIVGPVSHWEPRATLLAETNPSALDAAIANVNLKVRVTR